MTGNHFERVDRLFTYFVSRKKCAKRRIISREIIAFSGLQFPLINFFDLGESILLEFFFAIDHTMVMRLRCIDAFYYLFGIGNSLCKEGFGYCF